MRYRYLNTLGFQSNVSTAAFLSLQAEGLKLIRDLMPYTLDVNHLSLATMNALRSDFTCYFDDLMC